MGRRPQLRLVKVRADRPARHQRRPGLNEHRTGVGRDAGGGESGNLARLRGLRHSLMSSTWTSETELQRQRENSGGNRKGGGEATAVPEEEGVRPLEKPALREESLQSLGPEAPSLQALKVVPVPAGHPPSWPCPSPERASLPVPLSRKPQVQEVDAARASRPLVHVASPRGDGAAHPCVSPVLRGAAAPERKYSLSPCLLLQPGWGSGSAAWSFGKSPVGVCSAC